MNGFFSPGFWKSAILFIGVFSFSSCLKKTEEDKRKEDFLLFFQNTAISDNLFTFAPQFHMAEEAGIRRFIFHLSDVPWSEAGGESRWKAVDRQFERYWSLDPGASVAPRILLEPYINLGDWTKSAAVMNGRGEPSEQVSISSPVFLTNAKEVLRSLVRHMESGENADHVWAYYLAGQETGEWIPWNYRTQGIDYSEVSREGFRNWLCGHYSSDEAFAISWGREGSLRKEAALPVDASGRFPMHPLPPDRSIEAFYDLPEEQDWVDYSEYASDLNVRWIQELSEVVHGESVKPVLTFYGYVFELPGSMCGHLKAGKLLREGRVRFLGGPIAYWPYVQRLSGGVGGPMGAVDSMALHGVTWMTEDDTKTHASMPGIKVPTWYWDERDPTHRALKNAGETNNLHRRNLAFSAFHGTSTWWMDLIAAGWFSDQSTWDLWAGRFGRDLRDIHKEAVPYSPTLAVIVDEESRLYEKWVYSGFEEVYPTLRNAVMACGASVGFYYLDDFLEGRVSGCSAYLFVNAWRLSEKRLKELHSRLANEKATVIWQYAPGYLNPESGGVTGMKTVSGFEVASDGGRLGSKGVGTCEGLTFGGKNPITPRILIQDPASRPLARYLSGEVSGAEKLVDGRKTVLIADIGWTSELVHRLLGDMASTDRPAVVQRSEKALFVYAVQEGKIRIQAPAGKVFEDGNNVQTANFCKGESLLLKLKSR